MFLRVRIRRRRRYLLAEQASNNVRVRRRLRVEGLEGFRHFLNVLNELKLDQHGFGLFRIISVRDEARNIIWLTTCRTRHARATRAALARSLLIITLCPPKIVSCWKLQ